MNACAFDTGDVWRTMNRGIAPSFSTGQPIAKAGVDLALYVLNVRILGQTAARRWQVPDGGRVKLSWTAGLRTRLFPRDGCRVGSPISRTTR